MIKSNIKYFSKNIILKLLYAQLFLYFPNIILNNEILIKKKIYFIYWVLSYLKKKHESKCKKVKQIKYYYKYDKKDLNSLLKKAFITND